MARSDKGKRGRAQWTRGATAFSRLRQAVGGFLFGTRVDDETAVRLREIKGLLLFGASMWLLVSLASFFTPYRDPGARGWNWGGQAGFYLANAAFLSVGLASYVAVVLCLVWGAIMIAGRAVSWVGLRFFGGVMFVMSTALLLDLCFGGEFETGSGIRFRGVSAGLPYGYGGRLAQIAVPQLARKFGGPGLLILLLVVTLVSFLLATERAFYPSVVAFRAWLEERREKRGESFFSAVAHQLGSLAVGIWNFLRGNDLRAEAAEETPAVVAKGAERKAARAEAAEELFPEDEEEAEKPVASKAAVDDEHTEDEEDDEARELVPPRAPSKKATVPNKSKKPQEKPQEPPTPPAGPWQFPPLDLLIRAEAGSGADDGFLEDSATKLEGALRSFRVEATVVGAQVGPAVTMFELTVAQGTRLNKVTQLSGEIAAALRAKSVRIIAPIPGRETIGIEVPNLKRRVVRIRELVNQQAYDPKVMALPLFIGMDTEGVPIIEDLARMPHLLLAGTTGSGKSVCINTILCSLLLTRSPHDVKMILVDPKMVEMQMFANVPHLMCPVVTDARQATQVLLWAVEKMEGRYELFKSAAVKNIKAYNALSEEELKKRFGTEWDEERTPRHVPYIIVVVDEMADLMMTSKKEAELAITRLAQKSRAVGIHVIVATQRPSTDVITGVIKGNLPTRIAFQVASKIDSRVILDHSGAEKLLGGGDMLYTPPQSSSIKRVQGALVEDSELQAVVAFVCNNSAPNFSQELVQVATGERPANAGEDGSGEPQDPMWDDAVRVILKSKRGSASLLQRALGIGYTRASRLIDMMTDAGIVGPYKGSKVREILMSLEDWEEAHGAKTGQPSSQGAPDE
ncbi:MAG TPA: DNA translocase FtsK 4TM domain-containing protein [Planctomycetota bacterium]|jgi:S-DNA-T family DNA segregation ATPase FtsK/SpoIIIE|nr:DNA translocase FtsK 4TM domain-containing protein [Planctomycetota bacterium]